MSRKMLSFVGLILVVALFVGCAAVAQKTRQKTGVGGGIITGGVESLVISPGSASIGVGETITLKATGFDAKQAAIKRPGAVNPTWSVDDLKVGKLDKTQGKDVIFTGLAPGVCYIEAVQGNAKVMIAVEVK